MKELVAYFAKHLVDDPSQIQVTETSTGASSVLIELHVAPSDVGRVIGRGGRVANAMRTLLKVMATRTGKRVNLEIP
jgi:hypothetical protein